VSSLTDASSSSLLSPEALSVVQATAPVVAAHADQITARFYPRMFNAHPSYSECLTRAIRPPESRARHSQARLWRTRCS
jgi:hemoglobin-like flavoprotein